MRKIIVFAVLALLLVAACGPGLATGPQNTKVRILLKPAIPGFTIDICDPSYPSDCAKISTKQGADFKNVPTGSRAVRISGAALENQVTKYISPTKVQDPKSWITTISILDAMIDSDGDKVPDPVWYNDKLVFPGDNCPKTPNPKQQDWDKDGVGDACDDSDGDGWNDDIDNCVTASNADQSDVDGDKVGDACDPDDDNDGIDDKKDNCPFIVNLDQIDTDANSIGDACQLCAVERIESGGKSGTSVAHTFTFGAKGVDRLEVIDANINHHHNDCANNYVATLFLNDVEVGSDSSSGCPDVLESVLYLDKKVGTRLEFSSYIGSQSWGIGNLILYFAPSCFGIKPPVGETCVALDSATTTATVASTPAGVTASVKTIGDVQNVCYS